MPSLRCLAIILGLQAAVGVRAVPWPAVDSDLPPDPAVSWGLLPNGLRYAIMPNAEPKDRITLRLLVAAGSLHERDDERGLAHFIEHMVFRGTKAHPGGSLVATLQRLGVGLGPDNTAFTTPNYTIYHLELADTRPATLREGLEVFREYAESVTFDPELIERERGVILSEKATRNTPEERTGEANLAFLWPNAREVRRFPIGLEASVRQFTRDQFVAFYDAWYRPERMAVIIVGRVETEDAARLVADVLGPLRARAPPRDEPADLVTLTASSPNIAVWRDPGWSGVMFNIEHPMPEPRAPDRHARRVLALQRALAFAMFQSRLEEASHQAIGSYVAPVAGVTTTLSPEWLLASVAVSGQLNSWQWLAADLEREHRRAFQFGFNGAELQRAKARFAAAYEEAERTAGTLPSPELAAGLAGALLYGNVFATPAVVRQDLAGDLDATTAADCLQAFRGAWTVHPPHVFLAINSDYAISATDVARVLNESREVAVLPSAEKAAAAFAYTDFGPAGTLAKDVRVADLDLHLAEFTNRVALNFKPTPFAADAVDICVRVGTGKLAPPPQDGLDYFADAGFTSGGLGRHSAAELNELLAGRNLAVSFSVGPDACVFAARCARRDLLLCLQIIAAYLTDAAYRPEMIRDTQASLTALHLSLANSPSGPITANAERILTGGDRRFGVPPLEQLQVRNFAELKRWLDPQLRHGAVDLSIVGDVTWDEVLAATSRTFGALPERPGAPAPAAAEVHFARLPSVQNFRSSASLSQSAIVCYWPAPGIFNIYQERRCYMLAAVLAERVRVRLREELGATYTPAASFVSYPPSLQFNYFVISAEIAPGHLRQAAQIIADEIKRLVAKGVDAETFARVRPPLLRSREDELRSNAYWLYTVLSDIRQHPEHIVSVHDRATDMAAIGTADLQPLLQRYFAADNIRVFVAEPGPTRPPSTPTFAVPAPPGALSPDPAPPPDKRPALIRSVRPVYPFASRKRGVTGRVLVEFVVDLDGHVIDARAVDSPDPDLAQAAVDAVSQWEFVPAEKDGRRVQARLRLPVEFAISPAK